MDGRTSLDVQPESCGFVATVRGVALAQALPAATIDGIHAAFARYPVLVFPAQDLDPGSLERCAGALGDYGADPYVAPLPDHPHVIAVRREAGETAPVFGSAWHSDWSFQAAPPSATLLYAVEVPPIGGDTLFADGCGAFEALSPTLQNLLVGLRGVHSAAPSYGPHGLFARDDPSRSMAILVSAAAEARRLHPLVRRHPPSGRRALFVNHVYTVGIEGMHDAESRALLDFLCAHLVRPATVHRHRWQPGTLVMWDNRRVVHRAEGGYRGYRRLMYRCTLAGEEPRA